jgi:hypothetical protein
LGRIIRGAKPDGGVVVEVFGGELVVEADSRIDGNPAADAPVILYERLDVGIPVVSDHAAAFIVTIEIAQEGIGVAILSIVGHG